ncbi:DNA polymerase I [Pseudothermotoga thermarum]|uniref:DNA polymerase I n=1 Tax=Pseudothermotoga thermarum DSM 5069 TaxID=688269 RepID=F7YV74_9THEM|nr:DNA polymerase I [Pseudothermotoga thermarum]AEH50373.1 DNA polymerase I [Pseudothermotoga thermarum DSM 5069]
MAKLFLFDGTGLTYRAYYALDQSLSTSTGIPTNATYGVMRMMIKFLKENVKIGDCVAFVMDKKTKTYRHEILATYKAQRKPAPDAMIQQIPYIQRAVEALGVKVLAYEGCEADDVIATLAKKGRDIFDEVIIVSGDKDVLQLVDDKIKVFRPTKGISELELFDAKKVKERFGVEPSQIVDLLALIGDSVDNVPGVKGIGEKTAVELVTKYGSIENIKQKIDPNSKVGKLILSNWEDAEKSKKLVTLMTDLDLKVNWEELIYQGFKKEELAEFLKEMEFASIMKELGIYKTQEEEEGSYQSVTSEEKFLELVEKIKKSQYFVIDLETDSLSPLDAKIVGFSVSLPSKVSYYVPIAHKQGPNIRKELAFEKLKEILEDKSAKVVGQNLKYDYSVLRMHGINPVTPHFDVMIAAYLLNPDEKRFSLDELALKFLNYKMISFEEIVKSSSPLFGPTTFADVSVEDATRYSAEDADVTRKLYELFIVKLHEQDLTDVMEKIEVPLIPVLVEMELNGVYIDVDYLRSLSSKYATKMNQLADEIFRLAGEVFNINSPKQIGYILFEKLKIKPKKRTPTGEFSTRADVLEDLIDEHPIVPLILEYRKYQKLKSTYLDVLPQLVHPKTKRVHTSFHQTGTATGRLSSSDPNLQNLPTRHEEGKEIRKAIVPQEKGWWILSADYSQIELRVLAHLSSDERLVQAFLNDEDIHALTASKIFKVDLKEVTPQMRSIGKLVNFSVIYGVSPYGLAQRTGLSYEEAQRFIKEYFELYPQVRSYIEKTINFAREKGYVRTLFGRKREVPQLRSKDNYVRQEGERIAINTPVQGTAADIMKLAMIDVYKKIKENNLKAKMILQVHDELVFEVPEDELEKVKEIVKTSMENVVKLLVPLKVEIEVGQSWE